VVCGIHHKIICEELSEQLMIVQEAAD